MKIIVACVALVVAATGILFMVGASGEMSYAQSTMLYSFGSILGGLGTIVILGLLFVAPNRESQK